MLNEEGEAVLSRKVEATEEDIEAACSQIQDLGSLRERAVAVDMLGGPATLLEATLDTARECSICPGCRLIGLAKATGANRRATAAMPASSQTSLG